MPDILSLSLEGRCNMEATWQLGPQGYTFHWVMIERLLLVVKKQNKINKQKSLETYRHELQSQSCLPCLAALGC